MLYNEMFTNSFYPNVKEGALAYFSNQSGQYDLWIYNPSYGRNVQITFGLGDAYSIPYWSTDAKRIAFIGRNGILFVVRIANRSIAQIDQFPDGLGVFLDWSKDGQKLIYTKSNGIWIYDVTTHQATRLNQPNATDAQWFPTGKEILFQAPDEMGISQLYRMRVDGGGKRQITKNTEGRHNHVRLSPDGSFVLYTTPGASISIIYTIELATGNIYEVKGGLLAKNYNPTWSPDSSAIAYSATAMTNGGYFSQIRTVGPRGENEQTLAKSNCFSTPVTWSVDNRQIAYLSGCSEQNPASEIWFMDVRRPQPVRLVKGGKITSIAWSPRVKSSKKKIFSSVAYRVQFRYPSHWEKVTEESYAGPDGFFQISAISSDTAIHTVCQNEASHKLLPYGTNPLILPTRVQDQEACFIFPSPDQPQEMRGQAALIVRYPTPVLISGTAYNYFILWADFKNIKGIAKTLTFL